MPIFRLALIISMSFMLSACASVISTTTGNSGLQENTGTRSAGARIDDSSIETRIKVNLSAADERFRDANVSVNSFNATVLLTGQVPNQALKDLATQVATASSSRIRTVHNELEVTGNASFLSRSNDVWLATRIKTLMLVDGDIEGLRTKVITENGVVYLMGLLTQEEANQAVQLVSNTRGVAKVVRAFEYID